MRTACDSTLPKALSQSYALIDTHTHFDEPMFAADRKVLASKALAAGVQHLVLVGYLQSHFERMQQVAETLNDLARQNQSPKAHLALGLHPFYIEQHSQDHLDDLADRLNESRPLAIGEIGLDTFTNALKQDAVFAKQQRFFDAQLDLAVQHQLPVMLHIRKAHAKALAMLKSHDFEAKKLGGIAHSFSGGEQEAKAFVKLGFKLGVTGQVSNPNAKKLRRAITAAVDEFGLSSLVIETDCPDMTPVMCQAYDSCGNAQPNVPANLLWVLFSLSELLNVAPDDLAEQLWQNTKETLQL